MIRSLTDEGHAPNWLKDKRDVPYRGIFFFRLSDADWFVFGLLFPRAYLVLITSSGFALIFTYAVIMASHIRFRKGKAATCRVLSNARISIYLMDCANKLNCGFIVYAIYSWTNGWINYWLDHGGCFLVHFIMWCTIAV